MPFFNERRFFGWKEKNYIVFFFRTIVLLNHDKILRNGTWFWYNANFSCYLASSCPMRTRWWDLRGNTRKRFCSSWDSWPAPRYNILEGTVSLIFNWPSMQKLRCPIHNGTLETFNKSIIWKIWSFL